MALTLQTLISQLGATEPQTPVFSSPVRAAGTPEEVETAFSELNRVFSFSRTSNALQVNEAINLSDAERRYVNASVASFNERISLQQLTVDTNSDGAFAPVATEGVNESQGTRIDGPDTTQPASAVAQPSSAGCSWQWWFNAQWWGFKLSFNSCAISWLSAGGKAIDLALNSFKLPSIATPVVKLAALILKPFDKGNGSTIYFTWLGAFWITAK